MFLIYFMLFLYLMIILFSFIQYQIKLSQSRKPNIIEENKQNKKLKKTVKIEKEEFIGIPSKNFSLKDIELRTKTESLELPKEEVEVVNNLEKPAKNDLEERIFLEGKNRTRISLDLAIGEEWIKGIIFSEIFGLPRAKKAYKYRR